MGDDLVGGGVARLPPVGGWFRLCRRPTTGGWVGVTAVSVRSRGEAKGIAASKKGRLITLGVVIMGVDSGKRVGEAGGVGVPSL